MYFEIGKKYHFYIKANSSLEGHIVGKVAFVGNDTVTVVLSMNPNYVLDGIEYHDFVSVPTVISCAEIISYNEIQDDSVEAYKPTKKMIDKTNCNSTLGLQNFEYVPEKIFFSKKLIPFQEEVFETLEECQDFCATFNKEPEQKALEDLKYKAKYSLNISEEGKKLIQREIEKEEVKNEK